MVAMEVIRARIPDKLWVGSSEFPDWLDIGCERKRGVIKGDLSLGPHTTGGTGRAIVWFWTCFKFETAAGHLRGNSR